MLYLGKNVPTYARVDTPACRQFQFGLVLWLSCWFGLARDTPVVQWLAQILTATNIAYQGACDTHSIDTSNKTANFSPI